MTSRYRALVARANYLSQDRSDIAYATKELSTKMSDPMHRGLGEVEKTVKVLDRKGTHGSHVRISRSDQGCGGMDGHVFCRMCKNQEVDQRRMCHARESRNTVFGARRRM